MTEIAIRDYRFDLTRLDKLYLELENGNIFEMFAVPPQIMMGLSELKMNNFEKKDGIYATMKKCGEIGQPFDGLLSIKLKEPFGSNCPLNQNGGSKIFGKRGHAEIVYCSDKDMIPTGHAEIFFADGTQFDTYDMRAAVMLAAIYGKNIEIENKTSWRTEHVILSCPSPKGIGFYTQGQKTSVISGFSPEQVQFLKEYNWDTHACESYPDPYRFHMNHFMHEIAEKAKNGRFRPKSFVIDDVLEDGSYSGTMYIDGSMGHKLVPSHGFLLSQLFKTPAFVDDKLFKLESKRGICHNECFQNDIHCMVISL